MYRVLVSESKLRKELTSRGLSIGHTRNLIQDARYHPGRVFSHEDYKYRFNPETEKFDDNVFDEQTKELVDKMITEVVEGKEVPDLFEITEETDE